MFIQGAALPFVALSVNRHCLYRMNKNGKMIPLGGIKIVFPIEHADCTE
jgi:hypothetical protein